MRPPCIGAILDTVKSWIGTGTASPARSNRGPLMPTIESGGGRESLPRSMCVVRNTQVSRTTHIGWERPVGLRLR